jgi:nucleotide-binding universal stress UspA family protein
MPLARILVGVDDSVPGRAAFEEALALSRAHGAGLIAVHAVPAKRPFSWRARQRTALMKGLRAEAKSAGIRLTTSVQHGNPAGVILLHAISRRPDLIVVGTHQRTGMERLRKKSVAEQVAVKAAQPVLVVPIRDMNPPAAYTTIVAAVDFSTASDHAVERAAEVAAGTGATLTLVHVVPGALAASTPDSLYPGALDYQHLLVRDAWRRLQEPTPELGIPDATVRARVLTGDPATEVSRFAEASQADLIVVGLTRRGTLSRAVFGATAARLVRLASQPVLIVPEDYMQVSRRNRVLPRNRASASRDRDARGVRRAADGRIAAPRH